MKTKKPKKRFETSNQIRDEIDRQLAKRDALLVQAEKAEDDASFFASLGPQHIEQQKYLELQAKRLRSSASRIMDTKLVHLKNKLSEYMTPPFSQFGIGRDISS